MNELYPVRDFRKCLYSTALLQIFVYTREQNTSSTESVIMIYYKRVGRASKSLGPLSRFTLKNVTFYHTVIDTDIDESCVSMPLLHTRYAVKVRSRCLQPFKNLRSACAYPRDTVVVWRVKLPSSSPPTPPRAVNVSYSVSRSSWYNVMLLATFLKMHAFVNINADQIFSG